jgi:hypothetical protein
LSYSTLDGHQGTARIEKQNIPILRDRDVGNREWRDDGTSMETKIKKNQSGLCINLN